MSGPRGDGGGLWEVPEGRGGFTSGPMGVEGGSHDCPKGMGGSHEWSQGGLMNGSSP